MRDMPTSVGETCVHLSVDGQGADVPEEKTSEEEAILKGERALTEDEAQEIAINFYRGLFSDYEMNRLLDTVRIQREILKILFSYWTNEPLRIIATAHSVRTSTLDDLKRVAGLKAA